MTAPSLKRIELAATRVCFGRAPSEDDLILLGSRDRWLLYRDMVRERINNMVRAGLPRTVDALGDSYAPLFDRWLAAHPPRTRYIREVVPAFVREGLAKTTSIDFLSDLAAYECARWEVGYADDRSIDSGVDEFDFEKHPVMNPALAVLDCRYHVQVKRKEHDYREGDVHLCVYRRRDNNRVDTWILNPMAADLVRAWMAGDQTVTESVQEVALARGAAVDPAFIEKLGGMLADFIERSILIGSRPLD